MRGYGWWKQSVSFFASEEWIEVNSHPYAAQATINLIAASWHQLPAGSLPTSDAVLARHAMVDAETWVELKPLILARWRLCSDGRYYRDDVARLVNDARASKRAGTARTAPAREARARKRAEADSVTEIVTDLGSMFVADAVQMSVTGERRRREERKKNQGRRSDAFTSLSPSPQPFATSTAPLAEMRARSQRSQLTEEALRTALRGQIGAATYDSDLTDLGFEVNLTNGIGIHGDGEYVREAQRRHGTLVEAIVEGLAPGSTVRWKYDDGRIGDSVAPGSANAS